MQLQDFRAAAARISGGAVRTPILTSALIDKLSGVSVFFKCEHLQRTGSFKFRGAMNSVNALDASAAARGVVAHSSGNHGAAVSAAAEERGIPCTIVVPNTTPVAKQENITRYGAKLVLCAPTQRARTEASVAEAARMGGATLIHPYNDDPVIAGQGTIGLELVEQVEALDAILVPVSGGGMITGIAAAARALDPAIRVIACEPLGKKLQASLEARTRVLDEEAGGAMLPTICDAIRTQPLGPRPWELNQVGGLLHPAVLSVSDEEVRAALCLTLSELKQCVEPAGAVALAGLLSAGFGRIAAAEEAAGRPMRKVALVVCGGNTDLAVLAGHVLQHQEAQRAE